MSTELSLAQELRRDLNETKVHCGKIPSAEDQKVSPPALLALSFFSEFMSNIAQKNAGHSIEILKKDFEKLDAEKLKQLFLEAENVLCQMGAKLDESNVLPICYLTRYCRTLAIAMAGKREVFKDDFLIYFLICLDVDNGKLQTAKKLLERLQGEYKVRAEKRIQRATL